MQNINCLSCNKSFSPRCKTTKYCCRSCQSKDLYKRGILKGRPKTGITKKCIVCGKEYYIAIHRIKKGDSKFCSRNCLAVAYLDKYRPIYGFKKSNLPKHTYKTIITPDGRRMREHRWLMEQKMGRKLLLHEQVHHIDGNSKNNNIDNLVLLTNSEHQRIELKLRNG